MRYVLFWFINSDILFAGLVVVVAGATSYGSYARHRVESAPPAYFIT